MEGYSGDNFADTVEEIHGADIEVVKRNELHKFRVLPKRFLVERTCQLTRKEPPPLEKL